MKTGKTQKVCAKLSIICFAFCALAREQEVTYDPISDIGPWEWNAVGAYHYNWDPFKASNRIPYSNPEYQDTVCLNDSRLTEYPLLVPYGTVAQCYGFYAPGIEKKEASQQPYLFNVAGGVFTNHATANIGSYYRNSTGPRSGKVSVSSGKWTSVGDFKLGCGYADSWLNVESDGTFEALNVFNAGYGDKAGGVVTNKGVFSSGLMNVGFGVSATGCVVNAGSMHISGTNLILGAGKNSSAFFLNEGTLVVDKLLHLGNADGAVSEFVNKGSLSIDRMRLGYKQGAEMSIYRQLEGATLTKSVGEWKWYYVGYESPARFILDGGTITADDYHERFYLSWGPKAPGSLELDNGAKMSFAGKIIVGAGQSGKGRLTLSNNSLIEGSGGITVGNWYEPTANLEFTCATGEVVVSSSSLLLTGAMAVGGAKGSVGIVTMNNGSILNGCEKLYISGATDTSGGGSTGEVSVVGADSVITNVRQILIGARHPDNFGRLVLRGGRVESKIDAWRIQLGYSGDTSTGVIEGWGTISQYPDEEENPAYIAHFGKVIADGCGEKRDLDFGNFGSIHNNNQNAELKEDPNVIGCNGWYSRNKGRLRMPHAFKFRNNRECYSVGDNIRVERSRLVNSFSCRFPSDNEFGFRVYSDLYAVDRDDIPAGLPSGAHSQVLSVHRIGCFNSKPSVPDPETVADVSKMSIEFRYDADGADSRSTSVALLRHDGSAGGRWTRVGGTGFDASSPYVKTSSWIEMCSGKWNAGFFAVVARRPAGTCISIR